MTRYPATVLLLAIGLSGCGSSDADETAQPELDLSKRARCFSIAKARDGQPGGPARPAPASRDPVEACARLWQQGQVKIGATEAPPLVACAGPGGRPYVVPSRSGRTCRKLALGDPNYRPPAGPPGFELDRIDNHDGAEVRSHSRRFCSAGRRAVAQALEARNRRRAVLRALARGYPKPTRTAARKGCAAGLRDAR